MISKTRDSFLRSYGPIITSTFYYSSLSKLISKIRYDISIFPISAAAAVKDAYKWQS